MSFFQTTVINVIFATYQHYGEWFVKKADIQ